MLISICVHLLSSFHQWNELAEADPPVAEALTDEFMQGIVDDYSESRRAGVVALDEEFWIVRKRLLLDPEGVEEALEASKEYEEAMGEIAARSAERRLRGTAPEVPASSSIVFFKSPGK